MLRVGRRYVGGLSRLRQVTETQSSAQSYHITRKMNYPQQLLYEIVAGVDKYHEFIPYCKSGFVNARDANGEPSEAGLDVGFAAFDETFVCKLQCAKPEKVKATSITESLFKFLDTDWTIQKLEKGSKEGCQIDLVLTYEFKDEIYNKASSFFARKITRMMVRALEQRAFQLSS